MLGHEYGHFIANHLAEGRQVRSAIGNEEVGEIIRSWSEELEADVYGLQLSVLAMRKAGHDTALSYWGADFFFTMLDVVERALHFLATGNDGDPDRHDRSRNSHPPPALRRQHLRDTMKSSLGDRSTAAINLAEVLQFASELLWEKTKPALRDARNAGRRPHTSWQTP